MPPLVSTGFEIEIALEGASDLPTIKIDLIQPPTSGAEKGQDTCQTDRMDASVLQYPPQDTSYAIPTVQVSLDDPPSTRWDHVVKPRAAAIQ